MEEIDEFNRRSKANPEDFFDSIMDALGPAGKGNLLDGDKEESAWKTGSPDLSARRRSCCYARYDLLLSVYVQKAYQPWECEYHFCGDLRGVHTQNSRLLRLRLDLHESFPWRGC